MRVLDFSKSGRKGWNSGSGATGSFVQACRDTLLWLTALACFAFFTLLFSLSQLVEVF